MKEDQPRRNLIVFQTDRILQSPAEAETALSMIDFYVGIFPELRDDAAKLLTEAAAKPEGAELNGVLLRAAEAVRTGARASTKPLKPAPIDYKKSVLEDVNRILKAPEEVERRLASIDNWVSTVPHIRKYTVELLKDEARRSGAGSALGDRLKNAASAALAGRRLTEWPYSSDQERPKPKPRPALEELRGIEVNDEEFSRIMRKFGAEMDPDADYPRSRISGHHYYLLPDGEVAGWTVFDSWRGDYQFQHYVVDPAAG